MSRFHLPSGPLSLDWFVPSEFGVWAKKMDRDLLVKLDGFRERWGAPVCISPVEGALGRRLSYDSLSRHNVNRWGKVMAADAFPDGLTEERFPEAYAIAKGLGFGGIGIYPDWSPQPGMHLDTQPKHPNEKPATWAGVQRDDEQTYIGLAEIMPAGWKP